MKHLAKEFHASRKGNCAESVAAAWALARGESPEIAAQFTHCGAGRAENGICGAIYAAGKLHPEKKEEMHTKFKEKAGSLHCREIRSGKKFSCANCVETAADILDKHSKK
ncbi:MAG: C-GCAxxG-C-C family protein [Fibrobacter sp.]|jgi:hypothetical protein|nr:C-GCAxxG-C-C family protein [Fibrobacter sp.]